jgi:hypothetical protein
MIVEKETGTTGSTSEPTLPEISGSVQITGMFTRLGDGFHPVAGWTDLRYR